MASNYDATEFVDTDFQAHKSPFTAAGSPLRAPSREEVDSKVAETQQRLVELKRAQEELERERATLEETRRRQVEFQSGRQEMIQHLTRGLGLLEEAEFAARRDAEQMARNIAAMRDALSKLEAIHDETWTKENFDVELTRALTNIENARMEWNGARLKFPVLSGASRNPETESAETKASPLAGLEHMGFGRLCKLGLALTWPVAGAVLLTLGVLLAVLFGR